MATACSQRPACLGSLGK